MDPARAKAHEFPAVAYEWTERDVTLYALAVGAAAEDATDEQDLRLGYERAAGGQQVLPTLATLFAPLALEALARTPGLTFDPARLLHGEQELIVCTPYLLRTSGHVNSRLKVTDLQDKGRHALVTFETESRDDETGELICVNRSTCVLRDAGGFATSSSKAGQPKIASQSKTDQSSQDRPPDKVLKYRTTQAQALLYRLCGDMNPLHADPELAKRVGYERPILHGLCTFGVAARLIIRHCAAGDCQRLRQIQGRFTGHVYPGEVIVVAIWNLDQDRVAFRCSIEEREAMVLVGSVVLAVSTPSSRL
eukprot:jgi/Chlat1/7846/Chrsp66S00576